MQMHVVLAIWPASLWARNTIFYTPSIPERIQLSFIEKSKGIEFDQIYKNGIHIYVTKICIVRLIM